MNLTPKQFAEELPKWYHKYCEHNAAYFLLEERLTKKAHTLGYLEITDLVEITRILGSRYKFIIANNVHKGNTEDEIKDKTREAIQHLNNPAAALTHMMSISGWGRAYASKTLRCICPSNYVALDSLLIRSISSNYLPSKNEVERYCHFLDLCRQIRRMVSVPGARENGAWFLADIEIALFQFVWDKNRIV